MSVAYGFFNTNKHIPDDDNDDDDNDDVMLSVVAESDGLITVSVFTTLLSMHCCVHCKPNTVHVTICSLNHLVHPAVVPRV